MSLGKGRAVFVTTEIQEVSRARASPCSQHDAEFRAPALVVATGGLSIPKMGQRSFGYDIARQFGIKIREPWPGLVPLVLVGRRSFALFRSGWRVFRPT